MIVGVQVIVQGIVVHTYIILLIRWSILREEH